MAHISSAQKAALEPIVHSIAKKHKVRATLRVQNFSTLVLTIRYGKIDFVSCATNQQVVDSMHTTGHHGVTSYWIEDNYTSPARECLLELLAAMKGELSTPPTIFDGSYHLNISFGRWDLPYQITK